MLDQVFIFGVTYSSEIGFAEKLGNVFSTFKLFLLLLLLPIVVCMIYREKWYVKLLAISSALLILVAVTMGNAYLHYFTLLVPHVVTGICIAYKNGGKILKVRKNIVCIICCTLLFVANSVWIAKSAVKGCFTLYSFAIAEPNSGALDGLTEKLLTIPSVAENIYTGEENNVALDVASHIPESDRDSVYCFGDEYWSWWYGVTGILPDYKYLDWHVNYMELMPDLDTEIATWIASDGSAWIVTIKDENISDEVSEVIAANYTEEYSNEKYTLYRRNG